MGTKNQLFLFEALDLISSTVIAGVFYGIAFTLYCFCTWSLYLQLQKPGKQRRAGFSLTYISVLFLCSTGILALNARIIQLAYINHHDDFPGGPLEYETPHNSITISYITIGGILDVIIEILTMAIQIRRLWIVWSGTRYAVAVTILPMVLLFSYIVLDVLGDIVACFMPLDQLGISSRSAHAMGTAVYAILSAFTIFVTGLIVVCLLLARRQHMKIMGTSDDARLYVSIVSMLVESYALASAWSLAAAVSIGSHSEYIFLTGDPFIKVIAYFLVVYRVANGKGWTKQTEKQLTSLRFNRGTQAPTDEASGIRSLQLQPGGEVNSLPVTHSGLAV